MGEGTSEKSVIGKKAVKEEKEYCLKIMKKRKNSMYGLKHLLQEEENRLRTMKAVIEERLISAPEGTLRVTSSKRQVQYMYCTNESEKLHKRGRYIKKHEVELVRELAQKEYDLKLKKLITRRLKQITGLLEEYDDHEIEDVYTHLHPLKQQFIQPIEPTWEQKVSELRNMKYEGKMFRPGDIEIYSKKGERVRSKSEKILADTFFDLGIEYKYESPLYWKDGRTVYPDFTFLSPKTGKKIYWEHDGRMGDSEYTEKAIMKIEGYIRNGIYPGESLILTFESKCHVINQAVVNDLIKRYLIL